jgi:hypothetical protein
MKKGSPKNNLGPADQDEEEKTSLIQPPSSKLYSTFNDWIASGKQEIDPLRNLASSIPYHLGDHIP